MVSEGGSVEALSRTDPPGQGAEQGVPRTPLEEVLAAVWCDVLDLDDVTVHDNFFLLGGTSLLATRVVLTAQELLGQRIPVRTLFENATIALLAERVGERLTDADRDRLAAVFEELGAAD